MKAFIALFGFLYVIAEKTGWSQDQILNTPFAQLNMMLADAPKLIKKKKTISTEEDLERVFGAKIE